MVTAILTKKENGFPFLHRHPTCEDAQHLFPVTGKILTLAPSFLPCRHFLYPKIQSLGIYFKTQTSLYDWILHHHLYRLQELFSEIKSKIHITSLIYSNRFHDTFLSVCPFFLCESPFQVHPLPYSLLLHQSQASQSADPFCCPPLPKGTAPLFCFPSEPQEAPIWAHCVQSCSQRLQQRGITKTPHQEDSNPTGERGTTRPCTLAGILPLLLLLYMYHRIFIYYQFMLMRNNTESNNRQTK